MSIRIRYCSILGCVNYRGILDSNIRTFLLPKEPQLRCKWLKNIEGSCDSFHKNIRICELHFMASELRKSRLVYDAVPSIFHPASRPTIQTHGTDTPRETCLSDIAAKPVLEGDSSTLLNTPAPANNSNSCEKCFEELTLKNKFIDLKEKYKKKQLALDGLKCQLIELRRMVQIQNEGDFLFCGVCSKEVANDMILQHICRENVLFLPCEYCNEPYSSTEKMLRHLKIAHSDEAQRNECQICRKVFYMKLLYDFHQQLVHYKQPETDQNLQIELECTGGISHEVPPKLFKCLVCNIGFVSRSAKYDHKRYYHVNEPNECFLCKQRFQKMSRLRFHMRTFHLKTCPPEYTRCYVCNKKVILKKISSHSCIEADKLICEHCSKSFETLNALTEHLQSGHKEMYQYKCEICRRFFLSRVLLDHHAKIHENSTFTCDICKGQFSKKVHLLTHMKNSHMRKGDAPFLCDKCGYGSYALNRLQIHLKTHGQPTFKCSKCPAAFRSLLALSKHLYRHRSESSPVYRCEICEKTFLTKLRLSKHKFGVHRRTEADRIYPCSLCPKRFFSRNVVKRHIISVHSAYREHQCTQCDKAYKHICDLNKHLRTHLGDKMYKCPECSEAFRLPRELNDHLLKHAEERMLQTK